jgi:hypothetical protein
VGRHHQPSVGGPGLRGDAYMCRPADFLCGPAFYVQSRLDIRTCVRIC